MPSCLKFGISRYRIALVDGSDGSGGVDNILANGPKGVFKQYFPLEWLSCPLNGGGVV